MLKAENASDTTITYKFGDRPPCTYSMKIQSLSQPKTHSSGDRYESRLFASGKYNWKLVIYPKGNEKDNGSGFISMYVELDTTSLAASMVLAYLTFFVYNKKENKYFTIQDGEGKQFNALRPVWGFSKVLPLDRFNDLANGYVFDGDQCEFGVDVMVPHANWELLSFTNNPSFPTFIWKLEKFSKLKERCYVSDKFSMGGKKWVLKLYPEGMTTQYCKSLSFYLHLADNNTIKPGEKIYVRADLRVLDPFGCKHVTRKIDYWYKDLSTSWGWNEFVSLAELQKTYLDKEGSLKVEIEFEIVSTTKYSP